MKQFFEQYGGVALGILALIVLIAMITPVGNIIKTSLQGTTETFSSKMNAQTDTMTEQMSDIMNTAGEFLNIKEDGKMYKGNDLYTGWDGDKAYLNGIENEVRTNLVTNLRWVYPGHNSLYLDEHFTNVGLNPEDFEILSFKIDNKILGEHYRDGAFSNITASLNVSKFETIVKTPSNFDVTLNEPITSLDFVKEIVSDDGTYKITKFSGTLTYFNGTDINVDDLKIVEL